LHSHKVMFYVRHVGDKNHIWKSNHAVSLTALSLTSLHTYTNHYTIQISKQAFFQKHNEFINSDNKLLMLVERK
jgi:hypothetical protein